ncbi:MAG: hypothetical protein HZA50_03645 [Planctomycetes bacterium]|nr:hypothetical protein [Planctomycetota bacterium]
MPEVQREEIEIRKLAVQLGDKDCKVREEANKKLLALGEQALPTLIEVLKDKTNLNNEAVACLAAIISYIRLKRKPVDIDEPIIIPPLKLDQ